MLFKKNVSTKIMHKHCQALLIQTFNVKNIKVAYEGYRVKFKKRSNTTLVFLLLSTKHILRLTR